MKPQTLLIFLFLIVAVGCRKKMDVQCDARTNELELVKRLLPGSYEWAYSRVRGRATGSFTETPSSTGRQLRYQFLPAGIVKKFENGSLVSQSRYRVDYEFTVTTYPADSSTIVIITDATTGLRSEFFRPWICNDSAHFYNAFQSLDETRYFSRR